MMPKRSKFRSLLALLVCLGGPAIAEPTRYPLTIENCGNSVTFTAAPKRVVSVGQTQTEILYALGLGERVVGTAVWFGPVDPAFASIDAKAKRLADNDPSFESVVAQEPDLVTAMFEWHIGPRGAVGRREQFARLGIPVYVTPADCVGKDNTGAGDGVRTEMFTMALVHRTVLEYGRIFDVSARAEQLVAELKSREEKAVAAVAGTAAAGMPVAVWFSSRDMKGDAFMAGATGVPAYVLSKLGARNVIASIEEWPLVGWESIAAADPAAIVVVKMDRRRFPADDVEAKLAFLRNDPVASRLAAVRNGRIAILDVGGTRAGLDAVTAIENLAKALAGFGPSR